jgi:hypothetical protein
LAGLVGAMLAFLPMEWGKKLQLNQYMRAAWNESAWPAIVTFVVLMLFLMLVGSGKLLRPSSPKAES